MTHAAMRVGRVDAQGVDHGHRLGTAKVTQVSACHQVADHGAVAKGHQ